MFAWVLCLFVVLVLFWLVIRLFVACGFGFGFAGFW